MKNKKPLKVSHFEHMSLLWLSGMTVREASSLVPLPAGDVNYCFQRWDANALNVKLPEYKRNG